MESIIKEFQRLDVTQADQAFNEWIAKKNTETIKHSAKQTHLDLSKVDPALETLTEEQVDQLIAKLQKINRGYNEWMARKRLEQQKLKKEEEALRAQRERATKMEEELKKLKEEKTKLVIKEWKRKKDAMKASQLSQNANEAKNQQKPTPKTINSKIKPIKLKIAVHKTPFCHEVEHVASKELVLSPPALYSEAKNYQTLYPLYYRKYKNLIASGK